MLAECTCPRCGTSLSIAALEGLCPTCVGRSVMADDWEFPPGRGESVWNPEFESEGEQLRPEQAGDWIGAYKLIDLIGEGGFGSVWVAEQERPVRRRVALKIIKIGMDTKEVMARFEQERQALAMMDHPHIAKVFDGGATHLGRPFFVMELVRGTRITEYCDQVNLRTPERLALFIRVCQAVQHAHQKGIIHRDLKPSNILVTLHNDVPVPMVIDFGVAKAMQQQRLTDHTIFTECEQMIGTPLYISPEQAGMSGLDIDTRSDIYSLGVLLYELLTGRTPFDPEKLLREETDEIRRAIREDEPKTPSSFLKAMPAETRTTVARHRQEDPVKLAKLVRGDLDWIVMKALEKDRSRRYDTAGALADDIARHLASEPVLARSPSGFYRFGKLVRRHKAAFSASAAVVVALLAGLTGVAFQWRRAEAAGRAVRERLAHEHVRAGLRTIQEGDALCSLPHFVEALRLGLGSAARERVARLRFEMVTRQAPRLAQLWLQEQGGEAQLSEDLSKVVTCEGVEARVWDAATGAASSGPMSHTGILRHLWTDARATRVVTETREDHLTIWDTATVRVLAEMDGRAHLRAVLGGPRLRLAGWIQKTRTVRCISAVDGAVDGTFEHPSPISWAVSTPDGRRVLVAAGHGLFLWDVDSGALVVPPVDFGGEPDFGTFDPSGHLAGLRVKYEGGLALFDLTAGAIVARGTTRSLGSIRHGWLDGTRWVVLSRKFTGSTLRDPVADQLLFDAQSGAGTLTSDFAARRNVFVLVGENGAAQLWDADAGQAITPRLWAAGRPSSATLNGDGTTLLISSSEPAVRLWRMTAHEGPRWTAVEPAPAVATWWKAKDGELCTVTAGGRLICRDSEKGRVTRELVALDEPVIAAVADQAGLLFFAGGLHGARLWNAGSGTSAGPLVPCPQAVRDVALSADGRQAAIVSEGRVLLCEPSTGVIQHTLDHSGVLRCRLSADGKRLASLTDEAVQLWNVETGARVGEPCVASGTRHAVGARFDANGLRLAVWWGAPELPGAVRIISTDTGRDLLPAIEHPSVVTDAVFSPAGDLMMTASGDQRLWLWRTTDGGRALAPILHGSGISAIGFSPDGRLFWSRTSRLFHTWETETGDAAAPVLQHRGPAPAEPRRQASGGVVTHDDEQVLIAWSADHLVSTSDGSGGVNVWDFQAGSRPIEEMEALARVLSMHRIESGGGLVPLSRDELRAAWASIHH